MSKHDGVLLKLRDDLSVWEALEDAPHIQNDMYKRLQELDEFIADVPEVAETDKNSVYFAKRMEIATLLHDAVTEKTK